MKVLYESFFIGYYAIFIYSILWFFIYKIDIKFQLFFVGFLKHFISYYSGIQNYYCNHNRKKRNIHIFIESLIEGIIFILLGLLFLFIFNNKIFISIFLIGFLLHFLNDFNSVHSYFCSSTFV